MNLNKDIFNYSNFRTFLKDYFNERKRLVSGFSYRLFAEKCGYSSGSFLKLVMDGKRNLTIESIVNLSTAMGLNKQSAEYFKAMVFFNQAEKFEDKKKNLKVIDKYRKRNRPEQLLPAEFNYLKKWYYCIIREMAELPGFCDDPGWIVKNSQFPLKKAEAAEALRFLFKTGFLIKDEKGRIRKRDKTLTVKEPEKQSELSTIMREFHYRTMKFAEKAIVDMPKEVRSVANATLSLSQQSYQFALKRIEQLNYELLELAKSERNCDRIYQVNVTIFPFSKIDDKRPG